MLTSENKLGKADVPYLSPSHRVQLLSSESEDSTPERCREAFLRLRLTCLGCCTAGVCESLRPELAASLLLAVSAACCVRVGPGARPAVVGIGRRASGEPVLPYTHSANAHDAVGSGICRAHLRTVVVVSENTVELSGRIVGRKNGTATKRSATKRQRISQTHTQGLHFRHLLGVCSP